MTNGARLTMRTRLGFAARGILDIISLVEARLRRVHEPPLHALAGGTAPLR
jgi:hypothetical protein